MKVVLLLVIIFVFALIGFQVKCKYIYQKEMLNYIKSFVEFYELNISIFNNNIVEIINNYIIQQNNKNAKFDKIFLKNNNLYRFNEKLCEIYIYDKDINFAVKSYFDNIGNSNKESECEKNKQFLKLLNSWINKTNEEIKQKGDLQFKLWLAVGVVISIVLWWLYEYICFI